MTDHRDPAGDDELIARLRAAGGPQGAHDPYFDLPVAHEQAVTGDQTCPDPASRCNAPGRRPLPIPGYFDVPATEPVTCELQAGHGGSHRAKFSRTRILHHWRAFEWSDEPAGPTRS